MPWRVEFFSDAFGVAPVEAFMDRLQPSQRAKVLAVVKMLSEEGPSLPFPYASQIRGKLRELRTQLGKDKFRILYFGDANRAFVLLHGIVKRTAELAQEDIRIAEERMELHNRRMEGRKK